MNHAYLTRRSCARRLQCAWAVLLTALSLIGSARAAIQSFSLTSQWNLIAFQIIPTDPTPEAVFSTLPGFQVAWSYDASTGLWQRFLKPTGNATQQANDLTANSLFGLAPIEPGRAYWVFCSQNVASWEVSGTVPVGAQLRSLDLQSGWNLIGIPVGAASSTNAEPISLLAVLTAAGFDYDAILTWESQTFRRMFRPLPSGLGEPPNPLEGLPPDLPFPGFDLRKDLGRGYWIRVLDPAVLRPRLVTTVRPDIDTEPLDNFPSKEDINVSGGSQPARPKSVQEQDVIRFFAGEDVQSIGISNLGDGVTSGGGILLWEATWTPTSDPGTPEPWIRLFASPDQRERRDSAGLLVNSHTTLSGVATLESDIVYLRLDRRNLGRGVHEGTLLLRTSAGDKAYHVIAEVPGLEGDFKGYATIQSVNGKHNPVPDIDLNLSLYEDNKIDGLLRGLIDSSQALIWPADVPMIGYRVADLNNQFILGGSFILPPGDQNGEPFDQWDENVAAAGADVDWLNDKKLDVRNPFAFPIQRTVSLEGSLVAGNPTDGYILEGKYSEIVYGLSREPILLAGVFHLERNGVRPLSNRRSVDTDTGVEPVVVRKNSVPVVIAAGATRDSAVGIQTEMDLRSLQVALNFNATLPHGRLLIKLQSPSIPPVELTLYDGRTPASAINPKLLENVTFPIDRPTHSDFTQFLKQVPRTKTDATQALFWRIVILNAGPQPVTLANWTLRLEGQAVTDVQGVVKNGSAPLSGVQVALNGVPFSQYSGLSDSQGRFSLARVPLLPLNFSGARPGFVAADPRNPGLSPVFTRPFVGQRGLSFSPLETQLINRFNLLAGAPPALAAVPGFGAGTAATPFEIQLTPESSGPPSLAAGPLVAPIGTTVEFVAVNPASSVTWQFGDGETSTDPVATHDYKKPGSYQVSLFSPAGGPTPQAVANVIVLPAPRRAPGQPSDLAGRPLDLPNQTATAQYTAYAFQTAFTAGGAIPARKVGFNPATGADHYLSDLAPQTTFTATETNSQGAAIVSLTPIQATYAASRDIDLAPAVSPINTTKAFGSDGFAPLVSPDFDASINNNSQGFRAEDFNYAHLFALWQNTRAVDGALEYHQDAQNGLIVWGNTLVTPNQNFSTLTFESRDGADFTFAREDDSYHPHKGTTKLPELATNDVATHYQVACSIGASVLTAPVSATSVKVAKARRSDPDNPLDPDLVAAPGPIARNLYFQLHTGALGAQ